MIEIISNRYKRCEALLGLHIRIPTGKHHSLKTADIDSEYISALHTDKYNKKSFFF